MTQGQQLKLTSRQIAYMRLLEMPVEQLKTRIENELLDNGALEIDHERREAEMQEADDGHDTAANDDFYSRDEREDWSDAMRDYASEDDIPSYLLTAPRGNTEEQRMMEDSDTETFRDQLMEQVRGALVSEEDHTLMEYLIESLDDDGLLKKKLYTIADELEVYQGIQTTPAHLEELLLMIQRFDPPGIGARSLQECLLVQARRRHYDMLAAVIEKRWDRLTSNRWDEIKRIHKLTNEQVDSMRRQLLKLNPRPGNAMCETMGNSSGQVSIDFYVDIDDTGRISVSLNHEDIPPLRISETFRDTLRQYSSGAEEKLTRSQREALTYARTKISAAQAFIENLRGRQNTLLAVMQGIVNLQHEYFATGNEALLRPATMKELADKLGYDLSAISRVCNSKWVETPYGVHQLKWYFRIQGGVVNQEGELLEQSRIKEAIRALIKAEDKSAPLNDEKLAKTLVAKGFPVARRTVAKYREQLGLPVARLRQIRI